MGTRKGDFKKGGIDFEASFWKCKQSLWHWNLSLFIAKLMVPFAGKMSLGSFCTSVQLETILNAGSSEMSPLQLISVALRLVEGMNLPSVGGMKTSSSCWRSHCRNSCIRYLCHTNWGESVMPMREIPKSMLWPLFWKDQKERTYQEKGSSQSSFHAHMLGCASKQQFSVSVLVMSILH